MNGASNPSRNCYCSLVPASFASMSSPYYYWFPPPPPYYYRSPPPPPASGSVVGPVLGGLLMLIFVGICACCCKKVIKLIKWTWRRLRRPGLDNNSGAPSQPPKAEQYGGPPQHRRLNITPPIDGNVSWPPKPVPPFGVRSYQQPSSMNVPTPTGSSLGGIALGLCLSTFSYDELANATNGFSSLNLLGQVGFGYVHKGVLLNGKTVAIKQLKSGSGQGEREFQAEVEVISRVHHRHLASLVGYCMAGTQRMLVYEFVPNKTLDFHLHGNDRPTMDWPTRMKIAIGYWHICMRIVSSLCQPKIIHRDIKASNILLDDSFVAKLADFGLAKFSPDTHTHISTGVKGTFGYLAPEYAASGRLTGRKPVDKTRTSTDFSGMVEWARPLLSQAWENGNFEPLVDPRLQNNYILEEMARMVACATTCVHRSARRRPRKGQNNYIPEEMARMVACATTCVHHSARRRPRKGQEVTVQIIVQILVHSRVASREGTMHCIVT